MQKAEYYLKKSTTDHKDFPHAKLLHNLLLKIVKKHLQQASNNIAGILC